MRNGVSARRRSARRIRIPLAEREGYLPAGGANDAQAAAGLLIVASRGVTARIGRRNPVGAAAGNIAAAVDLGDARGNPLFQLDDLETLLRGGLHGAPQKDWFGPMGDYFAAGNSL